MRAEKGLPHPPIIVTKRLILRPPELGDIPAVSRLVNDKTIARWVSPIRHPYLPIEGRKFITSCIANRGIANGPGSFIITLRSNPSLIVGSIGLFGPGSEYTLGYWVGRAYRRHGFAKEAAKALIDIAFENGAEAVVAKFYVGNVPSRRVMERLGMRRAGLAYGYSKFLRRKDRSIRFRLDLRTWRKNSASAQSR